MKAVSIKLDNGQEFTVGETYRGKCHKAGEVITDEFWGFNHSVGLFEFEYHFCTEIYPNEKEEKQVEHTFQMSFL